MKAANSRNRAGGAKEAVNNGSYSIGGAIKADNNSRNRPGRAREAVNNRSNIIKGGHEGC